jgi:outer membrane autotransporter protein
MHQIATQLQKQRLAFCGRSCQSGALSSCCPPLKKKGLWASGMGEMLHQKKIDGLRGFHTMTGGALAGYDVALTEQATLGLGAGYTQADLSWNKSGGTTKIQGYHLATYTAFCLGRLMLDASALGSFYHNHVARKIKFPGVHRIAKSSPKEFGVMSHLGGSIVFTPSQLKLTPFVSAEYTYLSRRHFDEHGAESLNLHVYSTQSQFVRAEAGLNVQKELCATWGTFIPSISLSYVCLTPVSKTGIQVHFVSVPEHFTVKTTHHAFHEISPAASLGFILGENRWISIGYKGEFAAKRQDQELNLNLRCQF